MLDKFSSFALIGDVTSEFSKNYPFVDSVNSVKTNQGKEKKYLYS